jgi:predicted lipid-binding transport protein (Tim44 family)
MTRRIVTVALILIAAPFTTGCSTMSNTGKGALAGGGIGAGVGALVDRATGGKGGTGAIVGGAAGALIGGSIGNEQDQKEKAAAQAQAYAATHPPVSVDDVIRLTQERTPEALIINQIRSTNSVYALSTEDVERLNANGVSPQVIMEMQNRRSDAPHTRYVVAPPPPGAVIYAAPAPVIVAPPPPPPFGVGVIIRR